MKHILFFVLGFLFISEFMYSQAIIIDHSCAKLEPIPETAILNAKSTLHIAYDHTSHGSQITDGMTGLIGQTNLVGYKGDIYNWNNGGTNNALDIHDYFSPVDDLGYEDQWAPATRTYLDDAANSEVNVVMWSWCNIYGHSIDNYLSNMELLISEYGPGGTKISDGTRTVPVTFVFMTGHTNAGITENEWTFNANKQIRQHCFDNSRILYDFYDIESYNPDGNYFGDGEANINSYGTYNGLKDLEDDCSYNLNGGGRGNWAIEWQNSHTEGVDWYSCSAAHTVALNGNLKAYAAWWLWCRLSGWEGTNNIEEKYENNDFTIYPNPVKENCIIKYFLEDDSYIIISIIDYTGRIINTYINGTQKKGEHQYILQRNNKPTGTYFIKMQINNNIFTKKIIMI